MIRYTTHMKKILFSIPIFLFFLSCHKNKGTQVTCDSYMIGTTEVGGSSTTLPNLTLITVNTNTGKIIKNFSNLIQMGYGSSAVYDHIHGYY